MDPVSFEPEGNKFYAPHLLGYCVRSALLKVRETCSVCAQAMYISRCTPEQWLADSAADGEGIQDTERKNYLDQPVQQKNGLQFACAYPRKRHLFNPHPKP
jgi:hypothetical protein